MVHRPGNEPILPCVGEVVLIHDDIVPQGYRRLVKIEEVIVSEDDEVRVAKVRTANGQILQQAIDHLYPLEVGASGKQHQYDESAKYPRQTAQSEKKSMANPRQDGRKNNDMDQTRYNLRPRR